MEQSTDERALLGYIAEEKAKVAAAENALRLAKEGLRAFRAQLSALRRRERERAAYHNRAGRDQRKSLKEEMQRRLAEAPAMREAGLTHADIGAAWGISESRARQIVQRAIRIKAYRDHNG